MAKVSGIGARLYYNGYDVSGDVGAVQSLNKTQALDEVTGLDKAAMERIGLLLDGEISFASFFNPNSDLGDGAIGVHEVVKAIPGEKHVLYLHRAALGTPAAALVGRQASYGLDRADSGALRGSVQAQSGDGHGLAWGVTLTAGAHVSSEAEDLDAVDGGAASANGWAAYLQVLSLTGDDITVTLESSSDDGGSDAYAAVTNGAFTEVEDTDVPAVQRIADAGALERYVRVAVSGTFTSATFVVVLVRL